MFSELPPNLACFTTKRVIENDHPVLLVVHDEDGDWQFLSGTTSTAEDGRIICLDEALSMDPTL